MCRFVTRFILIVAAAFAVVAAPSAYADRTELPSVDLTLLLSTDVEGDGEKVVGKKVTGGIVMQESIAQTGTEAPAGDFADRYRVDTGDGISVTVYGEPDLSVKDARVKGNGTISYPLLGDLRVRGMTATQLQQLITDRLADGYLKNPNLTVSIDTFRMFYIKGEVRNPGGFNYVDGLTVEKAVALAGGFTDRASERNITVVRDGDPEQRARQVTPATKIQPGDVITVGESFF